MNGFMRFITDPQNLLSIGVGVAVFASVLTMLSSFVGGGARLDKRMKAVAERREELRRRSRQAMRGGSGEGSSLRQTDDSYRSRVVARLNLTKLLEDPKVAENMVQAAIKAVPLGQSAGQRILARLTSEIPAAVEYALALPDNARQAFSPMLAILSAQHEHQYSRLFRS